MSKGIETPTKANSVAVIPKVASVLESNENTLAEFAGRLDQLNDIDATETFFHFLKRSLLEMTNIKFALASFVVNNLRRRYRRSVLGFAWSLLNPLLTMCVMTCVFSVLFQQSPRTFSVYIFTGLLPWTFFCESVVAGSGSIAGAESFLKKVYIPKLFFPLVTVTTEAANFGFSIVALLILAAIAGFQYKWTCILVVPISALLFAFAYSCALFCSIATVYFRDFAHILRVGLGAVFYTIPIIYPIAMIPQDFRWFYAYHPFARFVELYRLSIYEGKVPT
ncbi:MAG: ABC transporter permease, partial [Candidatus Melainabacteria bacterium]|nr:ABC transporter permease [Candidatus Melainabacteria bacterium]